MRNVASAAELTKSLFAEIDKVENREGLEKLRVKYLGREKGPFQQALWSMRATGSSYGFYSKEGASLCGPHPHRKLKT